MSENDALSIDEVALAFAQTWWRHPSVKALLNYEGVDLGAADEYALFEVVLTTLTSQHPDVTP